MLQLNALAKPVRLNGMWKMDDNEAKAKWLDCLKECIGYRNLSFCDCCGEQTV